MAEPTVSPASEDEIAADWRAFTGGPPVIGVLREYAPSDVEGIVWRDVDGGRSGVVTWCIDSERAEIVSLHADRPDSGTGTRLMDLAEEALRCLGARLVVLATTNDNVRALNFYLKRGYRLVRVHLDAMDRVRTLKPSVPLTGRGSEPLRDMWELEKHL